MTDTLVGRPITRTVTETKMDQRVALMRSRYEFAVFPDRKWASQAESEVTFGKLVETILEVATEHD